MFIMSIVLLTRNNVMLAKRISILTVKPPTNQSIDKLSIGIRFCSNKLSNGKLESNILEDNNVTFIRSNINNKLFHGFNINI